MSGLKQTHACIYVFPQRFHRSGVWPQLSWPFCSGCHKASTPVSTGLHSFPDLSGSFPGSPGCWQNSVPCGYRNEVLLFPCWHSAPRGARRSLPCGHSHSRPPGLSLIACNHGNDPTTFVLFPRLDRCHRLNHSTSQLSVDSPAR